MTFAELRKAKKKQKKTFFSRRVARRRQGSRGFNVIQASTRETLDLLLANNKGAYQPAHPSSLFNAFVIRYLKSKTTTSDISEFSIYMDFNLIKPLAMPLFSMRLFCPVNMLHNYFPLLLLPRSLQLLILTRDRGAADRASPASLCCGPFARHIYPILVLIQPRKTLKDC